jgi:hypothetical protein
MGMKPGTRTKARKAARRQPRSKPSAKRKPIRSAGVNMDDLVGTIAITVEPVEFQRRIRDEW